MTAKPAEIKKLPDGKIAVRWMGKKTFDVIEDEAIAQYLIFWMIKGESHDSGITVAA